MKNLEIVKTFALPPCTFLECPEEFSVDADTGNVWIIDRNGLFSISSSNDMKTIQPVVSIIDSGLVPKETRFIGLQHVPDVEFVCIAASTGEVLTFSTITNQLECVGTLDMGTSSMTWSPDQELVLFTSGSDKLVLMNKEFDPIIEVDMHPSDFGESEPVTVGWGKKETQFHGSLGKQSAIKKEKAFLSCFPWDDWRVRVCWRGDGQFFAISSVSPTTGSRIIRVWTRDCTLHSTSEDLAGMEHALYWRPAGNLLATSQRKPHKHDIIFFEPNGLKHGEFSLPFDKLEMKVKELMWNTDSSVLALWLENLDRKELEDYNDQHGKTQPCPIPDQVKKKTRVQLWYVNNYHWYLKQELRFDDGGDGDSSTCVQLARVHWDPILPYKLHILTKDGRYMSFEWRWVVSRSKALSPDNMACVSVIDGDQLLLTPFRVSVVPPPMSAQQLSLQAPILHIAFGPLEISNDILVITASGVVSWYSYHPQRELNEKSDKDAQGFRIISSGPHLVASGSLPHAVLSKDKQSQDCLLLLFVRHFVWWRRDTVLCVVWDSELQQDSLVVFTVEVADNGGEDTAKLLLRQRKWFSCDHVVTSLVVNPHTGTAAVQWEDGRISRVDCENGFQAWFRGPGLPLSFPQPCSFFELGFFGGEEIVVGLTDRYRLFFNDKEIATDCMSFCFHDDFFLFTTHSHTCRVISLQTSLKDIPHMSGDTATIFDESLRRVERGSKIVTVVPCDTKVVLQMPRGNLETIHPRALVLSCVRKALDKLEYKRAFQLMKKHRINMNLTVDHNPKAFLANIKVFIHQLRDTAAINLFLTELKEENVTETMYKGLGGNTGSMATGSMTMGSMLTGSKVDRVCDAMITELTSQDPTRFLLSIVTAHVKKSKPEMESALLKIKQIKDHPHPPLPGDTDHPHPPPPGDTGRSTAEQALEYLLYLVDVNELYNVALGMYDFELVLFVAEKSQKDPKEYLPYLNHLKGMDHEYMCYSIDKQLGRFRRALEHVVACGPERFDECLSFVKEHSLYVEALQLLKDRKEHYKVLAKVYGDHLMESKKFEDAGIAYTRAACLPEAKEAYEKGLCWQKVFVLLTQMSAAKSVIMETARKMAEQLRVQKRCTEAARVLEDYAEDSEEAIVVLLEAWQWAESLRVIYFHRREDLIESHVLPALKETSEKISETLTALQDQLMQQSERLAIVRENKRKKLETLALEETLDELGNDLFSEASSVTGVSVRSTSHSTASSRTAKSRRKADKKKYSLKEGSRYEDIGLMQALSEAITTLDKYQDDIKELLTHLILFQCDEEVRSLQEIFGRVLLLAEERIPLIWVSGVEEVQAQNNSLVKPQTFGPQSTVNSIIATATKDTTNMAVLQETVVQDLEIPKKPTLRKDVAWRNKLIT